MTAEDLKRRLAELRRELESAGETDVHIRDMLGSLMADIVVIAGGGDAATVDRESLRRRLEQQATGFETRHPRVAGIIRQIMDQLARLGI